MTRTALEAYSETAARARQAWQGARLNWPDSDPAITVTVWYNDRDVEHATARPLDGGEVVAEGSLAVLSLMTDLLAK